MSRRVKMFQTARQCGLHWTMVGLIVDGLDMLTDVDSDPSITPKQLDAFNLKWRED